MMIVQILVRVPWDGNDNPQVKSVQWLVDVITAGIDKTEDHTHYCTYDPDTGTINILRD